MKKIKELNQKYLVVKLDDMYNTNILSTDEYTQFRALLHKIFEYRKDTGKQDNKYVVLNQSDALDLTWLVNALNEKDNELSGNICVEDVAVDLVNSIILCPKYEWCECGDELHTEVEKKTGVCSLCESLGREWGVSDVDKKALEPYSNAEFRKKVCAECDDRDHCKKTDFDIQNCLIVFAPHDA